MESKLVKPSLTEQHFSNGYTEYIATDLEKAKYFFELALKVDENHQGARYNLALILWEEGDKEKAYHHFYKIKCFKNSRLYIGKYLFELKCWFEGFEFLVNADKDSEGNFMLGQIYMIGTTSLPKNLSQAIEYFQTIKREDKEYPLSQEYLGDIYYEEEKVEDAQKAYQNSGTPESLFKLGTHFSFPDDYKISFLKKSISLECEKSYKPLFELLIKTDEWIELKNYLLKKDFPDLFEIYFQALEKFFFRSDLFEKTIQLFSEDEEKLEKIKKGSENYLKESSLSMEHNIHLYRFCGERGSIQANEKLGDFYIGTDFAIEFYKKADSFYAKRKIGELEKEIDESVIFRESCEKLFKLNMEDDSHAQLLIGMIFQIVGNKDECQKYFKKVCK